MIGAALGFIRLETSFSFGGVCLVIFILRSRISAVMMITERKIS